MDLFDCVSPDWTEQIVKNQTKPARNLPVDTPFAAKLTNNQSKFWFPSNWRLDRIPLIPGTTSSKRI